MRKIFKIIGIIIRSILIFLFTTLIISATVKNIQASIKINNFKGQGVYQEDISNNTVKYYKIEGNEELPYYTKYGNDYAIGTSGDIICSLESSIPIPFVRDLVSFFAGGHASYCCENYGDYDNISYDFQIIESPGLDDGMNPAKITSGNFWKRGKPFQTVIGLRVKMTEEERREVSSVITSCVGDPYNYTFLFNTDKKSYCSDLISKAYNYVGIDLNKDKSTTSIYDLVISKETYIFYFHYYDSDGIKHIYYLD